MIKSFFLWFYCLSITDAVLLVIVVSAGYLILRQWLGNKRLWRPVALLFLAWLAVIAVATDGEVQKITEFNKYKEKFGILVEIISDEDAVALQSSDEEISAALDAAIDAAINKILLQREVHFQ